MVALALAGLLLMLSRSDPPAEGPPLPRAATAPAKAPPVPEPESVPQPVPEPEPPPTTEANAPEPVRITLAGLPEDARVTVDGREVEGASFEVPRSQAEVRVAVRAEGYRSWERVLPVGESRSVTVELHRDRSERTDERPGRDELEPGVPLKRHRRDRPRVNSFGEMP